VNRSSINWLVNHDRTQGGNVARFWSKVDRSELEGECWPWLAAKDPKGYGRFFLRGRMRVAHAVAWRLVNGDPPAGMFVLHRCDHPWCCNPKHMFLGTIADNNRDMVAKGRHGSVVHPESRPRGDRHPSRLHPERLARGDNNGARLHPDRLARGDSNGARLHPDLLPRGARHGMSKLTDESVRMARLMAREGRSQRHIAKVVGVSQGAVAQLLLGKTWRHVDG
jgi:hypothetical protein